VIEAVTDGQILEAYSLLAKKEGVFVEPSSAASVAGLIQMSNKGSVDPGQLIVCTVTGHGLKDPDTALRALPRSRGVRPKVTQVAQELGLI
jgi:threonine synthase